MSELLKYSLIMMVGIILASFSQIMLKKSSDKKYDKWYLEYLNVRVIAAYAIFFATTFITVYAYRGVPLSMGAILSSTEYIFVAVLSYFILKERIRPRTLIGIIVIVVGVIIFALGQPT